MKLIVSTHFLAFLPNPNNTGKAKDILLKMAEEVHQRDLDILQTEPFFFACDGVSSDYEKDCREEILILDVFQGTKSSGRIFDSITKEKTWIARHDIASGEAQTYNLIELSRERFRLESDPLGIKSFYQAEVPGGTVLASKIYDLISIFPDLSRPADPIGIYGLMMMSFPSAGRTLHEKIRRSKTGACYFWDVEDGLVVNRERRLEAPPVDPAVGTERAFKRIFDTLRESLLKRVRNAKRKRIAIALSGGYDSRLLIALSSSSDLPVKAFTYGDPYHNEVYVAGLVTKALGLDHRIIPYPKENLILRLKQHLKAVEGQADLGSIQIANMMDSTEAFGESLIIGFMGDAIGGAHLDWVSDENFGNLDSLAYGIVQGWSKPEPFDGTPFSGMALSEEAYRAEVRNELCEDAYPYQALMIWDLENRQRRFIGSHFQILGTKFDVIAPYYDHELFKLWNSLPCTALMKRLLFHRMLASYFPKMAKIPHASDGHLIIPNLMNQLRFFFKSRLRKFLSQVPGFRNRDTVIENLWVRLTPQQESYMWLRIFELQEAVDFVFGIQASENVKSAVHGSPQLVRNLFMIAEYAAWLKTCIEKSTKQVC